MTRKLRNVALPRGGAARVSARLALRGYTLATTTINSVLNHVRGGKSGQPLRNHRVAQALVTDPDIAALGICLNDVLDPPINLGTRVFCVETDEDIHRRQARARAAGVEANNPRTEDEVAA